MIYREYTFKNNQLIIDGKEPAEPSTLYEIDKLMAKEGFSVTEKIGDDGNFLVTYAKAENQSDTLEIALATHCWDSRLKILWLPTERGWMRSVRYAILSVRWAFKGITRSASTSMNISKAVVTLPRISTSRMTCQ